MVGTWEYVNGDDVTTYVFKEDGSLWINGEYVDNYTDDVVICDNCLGYVGIGDLRFKKRNDYLYINFYKRTMTEPTFGNTSNEPSVVTQYVMTLGSFVKAQRVS